MRHGSRSRPLRWRPKQPGGKLLFPSSDDGLGAGYLVGGIALDGHFMSKTPGGRQPRTGATRMRFPGKRMGGLLTRLAR